MTDSPSASPTADGEAKRARPADHPTLKDVAILLAIGGPILAIVVGLATLAHFFAPGLLPFVEPGSTPYASTTPLPTGGASTSPNVSDPRGGAVTVGTCLQAMEQVVDCTLPHTDEVIAKAGERCDATTLTRYLSGVPGTEILVAPAALASGGPAAGQCVVTLPAGVNSVHSAGRALAQGKPSDAWRRCHLEDTADDRVPCSLPHSGEFIGLAAGSADCLAAFEDYAQVTFAQVSDLLKLVRLQIPGEQAPVCEVVALGHNRLLASVRNLRTSSLPLG